MNVETFDVSMGDRCGPVVSLRVGSKWLFADLLMLAARERSKPPLLLLGVSASCGCENEEHVLRNQKI
jgi:hypothetical protein